MEFKKRYERIGMRTLPQLGDDQFRELLDHLSKRRTAKRKVRMGLEKIARKEEHISRASYRDPRLYFLLMKFARLHCPIPFTTIDIYENQPIEFKKEKAFVGESMIVGFGKGFGYEIEFSSTNFINVIHSPIVLAEGELPDHQKEGTGQSFFLYFRTLCNCTKDLSQFDAVMYNTEWCIAWYRDGQQTVFLSKKNGLPRPERAKKHKSPALGADIGSTPLTAQALLFSLLESDSRDVQECSLDNMETSFVAKEGVVRGGSSSSSEEVSSSSSSEEVSSSILSLLSF